jgi:hypothetical protein
MKFFWLLLAVIVVAAGTMYFVGGAVDGRRSSTARGPGSAAVPSSATPSAEVNAEQKSESEGVVAKVDGVTSVAAPAKPSLPQVSADPTRDNPNAVDHVVKQVAPQEGAPAAPAIGPGAPSKTVATPAGAPVPATVAKVPEPAAAAGPNAPTVEASASLTDNIVADATPKTPEGHAIVRQDDEIKIVKKADGQMLVDDRYALRGDGSEAAPFEITWEYLVSAQETYDPKKGKKKVPERVAMLDGKHVRITGYIAFPLMAQSPKELLAMLNQWDGCCIGVPPTPYDAIEVRLKDAATQEQKFTNYGSVEGTFQVKPYVVGEWLVGLYVMNGANLSSKGSGVGT